MKCRGTWAVRLFAGNASVLKEQQSLHYDIDVRASLQLSLCSSLKIRLQFVSSSCIGYIFCVHCGQTLFCVKVQTVCIQVYSVFGNMKLNHKKRNA